MSELTLEVERREAVGKNVNRRLRAVGKVPAVVYGAQQEPLSIQVDTKSVQNLVHESGENSVFLLQLQGTDQKRHTMIRDLQVDPRNGRFIHIDFQRVDMDRKVRVKVPIEVVGIADGVKNEGGMIDFVTRELEIECLPAVIPHHFEVDVTGLHIGQHLEAKDVALPERVELVDEPQRVILSVAAARVVAEEAEEEEALLEAEPEEPEVIGRSKEAEQED